MRIIEVVKNLIKNMAIAPLERGTGEQEKAGPAQVFYQKLKEAESDPAYADIKKAGSAIRADPLGCLVFVALCFCFLVFFQ